MSYKVKSNLKNKIKRGAAVSFAALLIAGSLYGCSAGTTDNSGSSDTSSTAVSTTGLSLNADDMFTDRDLDYSYDESTAVSVTLADNASTASGSGVTVDGNTITITAEGVYVFSGTLTDGQIVVDTDNAKVQIVLNGVSITNSSSAAIYVKEADKVFVTTASGSENSLATTGEFVQTDDNNVDGVIFAKSDLTLNGAGSLTISSASGAGIVSKDDLKLTGGTVTITAASHALEGKDSVRIADGTYNLTADKDGIHSENTDDAEAGFVYIGGGTINITASGDGIDAEYILQLDGGTVNVTAGGGARNADTVAQQMGFGNYTANGTETDEETASTKGIKSDTVIIINDGTVSLDSADDALHTDGDVYINGGSVEIASGDDGIHADADVNIAAGSVNINYSYEGIEGQAITISGGDIIVHASDDGLNSSGGNDSSGYGGGMMQDEFASVDGCVITISGGTLFVNSDGDGIDSNGDIAISGGEIYVEGAENGGNAAFDFNGTADISGGTIIAVGYSSMAQNFTTASQGSMLVTLSSTQSEGTVSLTGGSGNELASYTFDKSFNSVLISTPDIEEGATYTLTAGSESQSIEMSSLIYGSGSGMGMGGGMQGGGMQGGMGGRP